MVIEKTYLIPSSVDEAIKLGKDNESSFKFIAGGTDVIVNRYQNNEESNCLIDISKLEELKGVSTENSYLRIGALETLEDLKNYNEIQSEFPVLIESALSVGSPLIRKTATLGGNVLCENRCLFYNQSEWWRESIGYCLKCDGDICIATKGKNACFSEIVSDTAPAIIALGGLIEFADEDGFHQIPLEDIYTGDGVKPRNLPELAIVKAILLPLNQGFKTDFHKLRERESLEFTSLTTAVSLDKNSKIKIALTGVDPKPVIVEGELGDDVEELIKKSVKGGRAVDNDMYSRKYRREMISVYLRRSFKKLGIN